MNVTKSKVDRPEGIKYLGYGFYYDSTGKQYKVKPHAKTIEKLKAKAKHLTGRSWGVGKRYKVEKLNQLIRGWINYFKIRSMKNFCTKADKHIGYRLRMCIWKHWKTPKNKVKNLMKLGVPKERAYRAVRTVV